ncbi:MAG: hypothetical protein WDO24_14655 [Pseudomonadota bacterium]
MWGQADPVVEMTQPDALADLPDADIDRLGLELAADIAVGDEGELVMQDRGTLGMIAPGRLGIGAIELRPQHDDLAVAPTAPRSAYGSRGCGCSCFQLGRLVDDMLGRGELAAIVQPGADLEFVPFLGRFEAERGERPRLDAPAAFAKIMASSGTRWQWPPV